MAMGKANKIAKCDTSPHMSQKQLSKGVAFFMQTICHLIGKSIY